MAIKWLCYDIKGIQQFIFSVSKLKYIVGASLLIDEFDQLAGTINMDGVKHVFSGGGKGTFQCDTENTSTKLRSELVSRAHNVGLDLRIGISSSLSEAARHADDLYPFVPDSLDNEPCSVSGLWPTAPPDCKTVDKRPGVHPLIAARAEKVRDGQTRLLDKRVLDAIGSNLPPDLNDFASGLKYGLEFLTAVRAGSATEDDFWIARAADAALGNRNRWAVLSMDGNDMGCQFRVFDQGNPNEKTKLAWMSKMSSELKSTTQNAFYAGLTKTIVQWWEKAKEDIVLKNAYEQAERVILPFRPLIVGGDDLLCLCHCSCAIEMAKEISKEFTRISIDANNEYQATNNQANLWPGTNGKLSISAGIAYTGVTLPLSLSIPYAEQLLAGAKRKYRHADPQPELGPTPAAIDWESVTESMIDTPMARRTRDLTFIDNDINDKKIVLFMRPYLFGPDKNEKTLEDIEKLKKTLEGLPRSFLFELMTTLTRPWGERVPRLVAMAAQRPEVMDWFNEGITATQKPGSYWIDQDNMRTTWFLDAVSLLEEEKRMQQETVL